ncbi:MAG: hypothetical protein KF914_17015 [Rhizobiaceae bacterium]|nr:hypothetical protein [Rhizobiaceae bacterium]
MRPLRTALVLTGLAAVPAAAAELPIEGNWGNEAGCRILATGNYEGEDLVALTSKEVQTYVTLCSYVAVTPLENGTIVATVICGHEGDAEQTLGLMRFAKSEDGKRWGIYSADGSSWGEVDQCK